MIPFQPSPKMLRLSLLWTKGGHSCFVTWNISNIPKDGQIIEKTDVWVVSELRLQSLVVEGLGWGAGV